MPDEIEAVKTTIELLGDGLLDMQVASGWPMTELRGGSALVFLGRFSSELIPRMAALGPCLRDWVHVHEPPLPEDICLFRYGADHPVLVSTTHEGDCLVFSHEDVEIPGVALEEEVDDPIDLSRWLFDRGNHFLRDGRPVLSTAIEVAAGTIRL